MKDDSTVLPVAGTAQKAYPIHNGGSCQCILAHAVSLSSYQTLRLQVLLQQLKLQDKLSNDTSGEYRGMSKAKSIMTAHPTVWRRALPLPPRLGLEVRLRCPDARSAARRWRGNGSVARRRRRCNGGCLVPR